jgi:signal transduction histidine kinase
MLANIIENAMKHSPPGAHIGLAAIASATEIKVVVSDSGPGIPSEERSNVFKRFYRVESSRSTPGSGLGLSLVQAIARLQQVSIDLCDNNPGLQVILGFASGTADRINCSRTVS